MMISNWDAFTYSCRTTWSEWMHGVVMYVVVVDIQYMTRWQIIIEDVVYICLYLGILVVSDETISSSGEKYSILTYECRYARIQGKLT